ncbi:MAG: hypothetical protein K0S01_3412 [Herbinix sp.]|jgi:hypothetical protein|nr:hypothetical protein [Herbinix sp.]
MKSLMNEYVEHKKFGRGLIVGEEEGKIKVEFGSHSGNKIFQLPDAFEQFLEFDDKSLQEESLMLVQAKKQLIAEESERKQQEQERQEEERKEEEQEQLKKKRKTTKQKNTK